MTLPGSRTPGEGGPIKEDIDNNRTISQVVDLGSLNGVEHIQDADDLPNPTDGVHQLDATTVYFFDGFVSSDASLELGYISPLVAHHGGSGGFIYTGGEGAAIRGTDVPFFAKDLSLSAPGADALDLSADDSTEMLVESFSISDFAGMGPVANLGRIEGYRVPTFKGCNFEDFADGLVIAGECDKVYFDSCPFRGVTESDCRILEFAPSFEAGIVDMPSNYIKEVQPDTEVIYVDPGATIREQLQYRGTTHDIAVGVDNILTGDADKDTEPYWVSDSYPLADTAIYGGHTIDGPDTVVIDTQADNLEHEAAYKKIEFATSESGLARFTHTSPNELAYVGRRQRTIQFDFTLSGDTGNDEILAIAIFKNGELLPRSPTRFPVQASGFAGGSAISGTVAGNVAAENTMQDDTFDVRVANLGSDTDIEVSEMAIDAVAP